MHPVYVLYTVCLKALMVFFVVALTTQNALGASSTPEYLPGKLVIQFEDSERFYDSYRSESARKKTGALFDLPDSFISVAELLYEPLAEQGVFEMTPVFRQGAARKTARTPLPGSDPVKAAEIAEKFERTYYVRFSSGQDPAELAEEISQWPGVVFAEPHFIRYTTDTFIPNDPLIGNRDNNVFSYHDFYRAWAQSPGSPEVVIAIVDSGVWYNHPDLRNKLWHNPEPGRAREHFPEEWNVENDTIGWNFWEGGDIFAGEPPIQNADPIARYSIHGTTVAGVAAADTDNGIGIAGAGMHSTYMAVKAGGAKLIPNVIPYGYQGILYAAINEADIINCSFGGPGRSEFGKQVVEYATAEGSLVVGAIGNNNSEDLFYPAAYEEVLAVGGLSNDLNDVRAHFSNYGYYADVFAVGQRVNSTTFSYNEDTEVWESPFYGQSTGTSFAAPLVSGLAALIKAAHPDWPPQRIAAQIRSTAESIYEANTESIYEDKLGKGKVNAFKALSEFKPGLRIQEYAFLTEEGEKLISGDSGFIETTLINYGPVATSATLRIGSDNEGILFENPSYTTGNIGPEETYQVLLPVEITRDFELSQIPTFRLELEDPTFDYYDSFVFKYEDFYVETISENTITATVSSDGTIGFMDAFSGTGGVGFIPESYGNVLFEGALMIHANRLILHSDQHEPLIINQARDSTDITRHFRTLDNIRVSRPGTLSDLDARARFDSGLHPAENDIEVELHTYSFSDDPGLENVFFIRYTITNRSPDILEDVHVGLFNDWDIPDYADNSTRLIPEDSLLYAYSPNGPPLVAVAHMGAVSSALAINNDSRMTLSEATSRADSLSFGLYYDDEDPLLDGFTDEEKRLALTSGTEQTQISNKDISIVTGTGPFTMMPMAELTAGFIYAWGESEELLVEQVRNARDKNLFDVSSPGLIHAPFRELADRPTLYPNYPNPFNSSTIIEYHITEPTHVTLAIYNTLGQKVTTLVDGFVQDRGNFAYFDAAGMASGVYIAVLRAEGRTDAMPMTLIK
ncbi:S8 family peptidase [Balneolaceae bacterium ANBcel3]|nr:S8 family peptidase [Balneolaceae bacterium ANBcel3]